MIGGYWFVSRKLKEQSFGGNDRVRAKHYLGKESMRLNTRQESARGSRSTKASASTKRDAGLRMQATLTDREVHKFELL